LAEQLTFTGFLNGRMATANSPAAFTHSPPSNAAAFPTKTRCGKWPDETFHIGSFWQADIVGDIGGRTWAVSLTYETSSNPPGTFQISQFGPGYSDAGADVWLQPSTKDLLFKTLNWTLRDPNAPGTPVTLGALTVAQDQRHGSIDVALWGVTKDGAAATVRVSGQWRCG